MEPSATLATTLASAIVKAILRRWIGTTSVAGDVTDILVSHVAGHVDELAHRKANAHANLMVTSLAQRLKPLIDVEFRGLADNDIQAVVIDVAATIEEARIGFDRGFANDLDASKVAKELRQAARQSGRLTSIGQSGDALADVFFREAATSIVVALQNFPTYTAAASTELLRRMTHLLSTFETTLDGIPVALTQAAASADEQFERRYRSILASSLADIQLYGARFAARHTKYPLSTAYISLEAAQRKSAGRRSSD